MIYGLLVGALFLAVCIIVALILIYVDMRNEIKTLAGYQKLYLDIYNSYRKDLEKELADLREAKELHIDSLDKIIKIAKETNETLKELSKHYGDIIDYYKKLEDRYSSLYDQYADLKYEIKARAHDILAAMPECCNVPDDESLEKIIGLTEGDISQENQPS